MTMIAAEVTAVDDVVDWGNSESTLLYDPKFRFPSENLLALARASARCPGLVHRELRRDMNGDAVARLFGLEVGGDSGCSRSTAGLAAADGGAEDEDDPGYVAVEPEELYFDYVVVGTADEVERERRLEADAEAALEAGWSDCVGLIEQLLLDEAGADEESANNTATRHVRSVQEFVELYEADDTEDARTARLMELVRDMDRFLEEEEEELAEDPEWNALVRTIEEHFEFGVHQQRSGRPE